MTRALLIALLLLSPSLALAEPIDDAFELHEQAIAARDAGDYDRAERLFLRSLEVAELNITWLNIGQLYGLMDRCLEARAAFDKVATAQPVEVPPPQKVLEVLEARRAHLDETCPTAPQTQIELDPENVPPPRRRSYGLPVTLAASGGAGLLTAWILDATLLRSRLRRIDALQGVDRAQYEELAASTRTLQVTNLLLFGVSSAALATGLVLVAITAGRDTRVSIVPTLGGIGLAVDY